MALPSAHEVSAAPYRTQRKWVSSTNTLILFITDSEFVARLAQWLNDYYSGYAVCCGFDSRMEKIFVYPIGYVAQFQYARNTNIIFFFLVYRYPYSIGLGNLLNVNNLDVSFY